MLFKKHKILGLPGGLIISGSRGRCLKGWKAMAACEFIGGCAFYNDRIKDMKPVGTFIKQIYCEQMPHTCERRKSSGDVGDVNYFLSPWGLDCNKQ